MKDDHQTLEAAKAEAYAEGERSAVARAEQIQHADQIGRAQRRAVHRLRHPADEFDLDVLGLVRRLLGISLCAQHRFPVHPHRRLPESPGDRSGRHEFDHRLRRPRGDSVHRQ